MPNQNRLPLARRPDLVPFLLVASFGLLELLGWWTGQVNWVQPRPYDVPIAGNTALCLLLLGLAPAAAIFGYRRTAQVFVAVAGLVGLVSFVDDLFDLQPGLDNLLVRHEALIEGPTVGRIPTALAGVIFGAGVLLMWHLAPRVHSHRPLWLALFGSVVAAYGTAALFAGRTGLVGVESWVHHAHVGPHTSLALVLLGGGFLLLARADPSQAEDGLSARWLWLPVVVAGVTISGLVWFALRERELAYLNNTTQLTLNNVATLFSGELTAQANSLGRMAARWNDSGGMSRSSWERDVRARAADFAGYRSFNWVGADLRTRWLWPENGNEEVAALDHSGDVLRRQAMAEARAGTGHAVAAPLTTPLQPPSLAIYFAVQRDGVFDGFIVGELSYAALFEMLDRRLNLSSRYTLTATVASELADSRTAFATTVFATAADEPVSERLHQSATFSLFDQRLTLELAPRAAFIRGGHQRVPEVALIAGLVGSALLGLIVNLARVTLLRQRAAERTSEELRAENEERRR
ncbi:MAG TPA: hypothetical protein VFJ90_15550, partial [Candidatus Didemnitutus sp.]|nr:hypothetical protein [Candidatus Didemnitutus sp.]